MLIDRATVEKYLNNKLYPEDRSPLITDLVWIGYPVHEMAFHCPEDQREQNCQKLLDLIERLAASKDKAGVLAGCEDDFFDGRLGADDVGCMADIYHKLVLAEKQLKPEAMRKWLKYRWDQGVYQQRVYSMEIPGNIMNIVGIIEGSGCHLALFGQRNGYLPEVPSTT